MVDFKARLNKNAKERKINPIEIYELLDRAVDKGPLRQPQQYILQEWFDNCLSKQDIIIKLHTGQGKTLIGLLILLSRLNQGKGPSLYLCPNKYLVKQTCIQANQFGIPYCEIKDEIPPEFLDGKKLLITSISKLFNGLSKFGIGKQYSHVETILIDDAHSCIEYIKNAFTINIKKRDDEEIYNDFLNLFSPYLETQGAGTFADIQDGSFDAIQYIPYWGWHEKQSEVVSLLSRNKASDSIKFVWPLIKDVLSNCHCVISGAAIEISHASMTLDNFGSFVKASQRIYMSATFFDDSFLVKSFNISKETISSPLIYPREKWAGEKMVLIPSLIHESLDRTEMVKLISGINKTKFGIVILSTSFNRIKDWEAYGCTIANKDNIEYYLSEFKNGQFRSPLVIVNRYDGIDLPDQMCRILVLDSKPYTGSLFDKYMQSCRSDSIVIESKIAQTIEQGMGRAIRGEKDYCAVILIGPELIKAMHSTKSRRYYSAQTRTQIEIGIEVSDLSKEDIKTNQEPSNIFIDLLNQLLGRDEGWKEFYIERMNSMQSTSNDTKTSLEILLLEKEVNGMINSGDFRSAVNSLQNIIDTQKISDDEKGWYLQEMARVICSESKTESTEYQIAAHSKNKYLLKPPSGMRFTKITKISKKRTEQIKNWVKGKENYLDLDLKIQEILANISFGIKADPFEKAFDEIGKALGFDTQRPDKEWKEGPDNLWLLEDNKYYAVECKSEVDIKRAEINKKETGQMNNSIAWFKREYGNADVRYIQVIPTSKINKATGYNEKVEIMKEKHLRKLRNNIKAFFNEFQNQNFDSISVDNINVLLQTHHLTVADLWDKTYSSDPIQMK